METFQSLANPARRDFLKAGASLAAIAASGSLPSVVSAAELQPAVKAKSIGIQIGAVSFADEGTDKVLDLLQKLGAVDTVYLTTFTYGRGPAGRQIPGHAFPDHGVKESDKRFFHGGNYATPHAAFYGNTLLKQTRAPDHMIFDHPTAINPPA